MTDKLRALVQTWRDRSRLEDEDGELEVGDDSAIRLRLCADELEALLPPSEAGEGDSADSLELAAWRELGRCVFLGLPTFPNKWPQDVSVIGYSLSAKRQRTATPPAAEVDALLKLGERIRMASMMACGGIPNAEAYDWSLELRELAKSLKGASR